MEVHKNKGISNQIQLKSIFNNTKSKYILGKIFNNLQKKKSLEIVKYNNNTKQRLNLNINDYIKYGEIEIEIIPVKNKYGKYININDKDEKYYHIYFENNKEEIKKIILIMMIMFQK